MSTEGMSKRKPNHDTQHSSRRTNWVQKRWKKALQAIKNGRSDDIQNMDDKLEESISNCNEEDCDHEFVSTSKCKPCASCSTLTNDKDRDGLKCQKCRIVVHIVCESDLLNDRKKNSRNHRPSAGDDFDDCDEVIKDVDPIYLALKAANKMASQRKQTTTVSNESPRGSSQTRDQTPSSSELTSRSSSNSKLTSVSLSSFVSSPTSQTAISKSSFLCSPTNLSESVRSAPNLLFQKSIESQEDPMAAVRKPIHPISKLYIAPFQTEAVARRAPRLDMKMKSLSLDCSESAVVRARGSASSAVTPATNRHTLRVPPCQQQSFDSAEDTARSSVSGSPCPSPRCGSTLTLPSNSYAVAHDYYAKFPEEIDLRTGERLILLNNTDPDWWQGQNVSGRVGIFPASCAVHIHTNERVMQVVQNVCLMDGSKSLRLYRDQIVFAPVDQGVVDGLITIRTERDHRINCPARYVMTL